LSRSEHLLQIVQSAIDSVRPDHIFPKLLENPTDDFLRGWVADKDKRLLTLGKASIDSAQSVLSTVECRDYFVLAPQGSSIGNLDSHRVHFGRHPIPDQKSLDSAEALISWLNSIQRGVPLLVVLSGGASALLVKPADGVSLLSKMKVNEMLIRSGATIGEMNTVRKHLSAVKGGQLAQKCTHLKISALVISDVIGDDFATIGSGPFYPDPTTFADARKILMKYELWKDCPEDARERIEAGIAGRVPETPKGTTTVTHRIVASNKIACDQACQTAIQLGYNAEVLSTSMSGFVEQVAERINEAIDRAGSGKALIFGGEATVKVRGNGTGGRNQHLALLMSQLVRGKDVTFGAVGTDGIDGNSPAAGAWVDGHTHSEAMLKELDLDRAIREFDSFPFFQALRHCIVPGSTGTNVMDLYIALT
jgi:glycerate 2-kinase